MLYNDFMKIILGIGNPDKQYYSTRHNIGFMIIDFIAKNCEAKDFEFEKKMNSEIAKCSVDKKSLILVKPQTYVNKTGEAAKKIKNFYKLKLEDILVIHDDLDIEFGNMKLSFDKDSAGHKGVDSVMKALKSKKFYRLRIGLANDLLKKARHQKTIELKRKKVGDFVLSTFTPTEQKKLPLILKKALEIIKSRT